jgi:asparagine synthase (glutamine-hydrolysing)
MSGHGQVEMCGIAVALDWDNAEATVRQLLGGVYHRGDITDPIALLRQNTAMGTRRLRIVDAERATQPQLSFDGRLAVSFNGEIYNHAALRRELSRLGVLFHTESDTEVLANALQVWGAKALLRLNGMFAFVALDVRTGEFLAARDPFGVKPLYVIQSGSGYLFCSEIRPLLKATQTGNVLLIPPGHLLTRNVCARYKTLSNPNYDELRQGSPAELDRILSEAVRIRLPTNLPFATMLSGGIDSTLISHYARQYDQRAPAYFLGGPNAPDFRFVAEYADRSGIELRIVPLVEGTSALLALIDEAVDTTEAFEPAVIRCAVCSYVVARQMHDDGFRISLCGEGADELFAGYQALELVFADGNSAGRPAREECLALMNRTSLQRVDRCSMRFSIETREPFLDPNVVEYGLNLDATAIVRSIEGTPRGKMPLRALFDLYPEQLPSSIRDRDKLGMDEGSGLELRHKSSPWLEYFDSAVSDRDLEEGKREFESFGINYKEELYCLRRLAQGMDVSRVPHLQGRATFSYLTAEHMKQFANQAIV